MNYPITEKTRISGSLKCGKSSDPRDCFAQDPSNYAEAISQELRMAISKHSLPSTRYRFTSRQICQYPGDEIPTRTARVRG